MDLRHVLSLPEEDVSTAVDLMVAATMRERILPRFREELAKTATKAKEDLEKHIKEYTRRAERLKRLSEEFNERAGVIERRDFEKRIKEREAEAMKKAEGSESEKKRRAEEEKAGRSKKKTRVEEAVEEDVSWTAHTWRERESRQWASLPRPVRSVPSCYLDDD